jgi:hypothetical protein
MRTISCFVVAICLANVLLSPAPGEVIYVNAAAPAPGGGDGTSWKTAFNDLQDGLAAATPGSGDQLWLAAGSYRPAGPGGDRAISFNLVSGTAIYGGFNGTETQLNQRDPAVNITILSGDLNGNDAPGSPADDPTHAENSERVFYVINAARGTVIDGLTITGGYTNGGGRIQDSEFEIVDCTIAGNFSDGNGGGLFSDDSNITVSRCRFRDNICTLFGGGMLGNASASQGNNDFVHVVSDCEFTENEARNTGSGRGGGAWFFGGTTQVTGCLFEANVATSYSGALEFEAGVGAVTDCRFINNTALGYGPGGFLSFARVDVVNCQFIDNHAGINAFGNGGGVSIAESSGTFVNCLFTGNSNTNGAGVYVQNGELLMVNCLLSGNNASGYGGAVYGYGPDLRFINCSIAGNTGHQGAGGIYVYFGNPSSVSNSILWGNIGAGVSDVSAQLFNVTSIDYSCVQGLTGALGGMGNLSVDPLFIDPDGVDDIIGTEDDNLRPMAGSPCIDQTDPLYVPPHPLDLDGQPRVNECVTDMGAYESAGDGVLTFDCNANGIEDNCDLASQTSADCNFNYIPDDCELASGASTDFDLNAILDECQAVPVNDLCSWATFVLDGGHSFTTVNATTDGPDEPSGCGFPGSDTQVANDVWFLYPAKCAGIVTVSLCGATFDARLAVYSFTCPTESGQIVACSDDGCGDGPVASFTNSEVMLYHIRIGGANNEVGGGVMVISCTPSPQCPGDADGNGSVNIDDVLLIVNSWGSIGLNPADLDGSGVVDIDDLLAVINAWGACL